MWPCSCFHLIGFKNIQSRASSSASMHAAIESVCIDTWAVHSTQFHCPVRHSPTRSLAAHTKNLLISPNGANAGQLGSTLSNLYAAIQTCAWHTATVVSQNDNGERCCMHRLQAPNSWPDGSRRSFRTWFRCLVLQ